jgi:hypothetical protein
VSSIADTQTLTAASGRGVVQAIKVAAAQTGSSFAYLLQTSGIESGFNPNAVAQASSAAGLFQFTGQTWMQTIRAHGAEHGLGHYASQIQIAANGTASVSDPALRQTILDLRKNPQIAAEMTAELGKVNSAILQKNVGGTVGSTELYLAHFLGAGGASSFLKAMRANPNANAAEILPAAAEANPSIFFGAGGQPRSVGNIYEHFAQVFDQKSPATATDATVPTLSSAFDSIVPQSSASSVPGHLSPEDARSFAATVMGQMNMAELTSALADDDETDGEISVLA